MCLTPSFDLVHVLQSIAWALKWPETWPDASCQLIPVLGSGLALARFVEKQKDKLAGKACSYVVLTCFGRGLPRLAPRRNPQMCKSSQKGHPQKQTPICMMCLPERDKGDGRLCSFPGAEALGWPRAQSRVSRRIKNTFLSYHSLDMLRTRGVLSYFSKFVLGTPCSLASNKRQPKVDATIFTKPTPISSNTPGRHFFSQAAASPTMGVSPSKPSMKSSAVATPTSGLSRNPRPRGHGRGKARKRHSLVVWRVLKGSPSKKAKPWHACFCLGPSKVAGRDCAPAFGGGIR